MNEKYISVTQLTRYIKYKIDQDANLTEVFLKGEISNFKAHTRGHYYFTLKDENSRINAIMFASSVSKLKFRPEEGMKVLVTGKVSVYEATGGYQIYVNDMVEDGIGNLYVAFEQLKKKLEQEGLFAKEHKRKIPRIPAVIGIVTAPTGAAIKDILSTIKRRWPLAKTILFPSLVQGEFAKDDIVKQIKRAEDYPIDVLIVGRGGGSIEDLWAFNEEIVARAIYHCKIPVISAVGHEVDFTISDFVADLRAPTPTGAAELSVPSLQDVSNYLKQLEIRSSKTLYHLLQQHQKNLKQLLEHYVMKNPISIYEVKEQNFDHLFERLQLVMQQILSQYRNRLQSILNRPILLSPQSIYESKQENFQFFMIRLQQVRKTFLKEKVHAYLQLLNKLEVLNPLLTLKRGYTIVKKEGKTITSVKDVAVEQVIQITFQDGERLAKIIE